MTLKQIGFYIVAVVLMMGLSLISKGCRKNANRPSTDLVLTPDQVSHIRIVGARIETLERLEGTNKITHKVESNYHHGVDIVETKDGKLEVIVKTHGFSDEFGVSTDFYRIGVAMEPYFYKDFHALIGCHFINLHTGRLDMDLYIALAYRIPYEKLNNISVYGGYDTDKHIISGMYLRFGSN